MSKVLAAVVCAAAALVYAPAALADIGLGGGATAGSGHVQLVSDVSDTATADDASWIELEVPSGLTFGAITSLAADFNVTDDGCGGGSPRFQITVGGKNVFVYLGPAPSFTTCPLDTWVASGNLVGTADACRVDTSQHAPGTQCSTWAAAVALIGTQPINSISLVVDGGWKLADGEQTVQVRNLKLNGVTFLTPTPEGKINPARFCRDQIAATGRPAFNELWNVSGTSNGFGKCVSAVAKARNAGATQSQIMAAIASCEAKGLKGAALGRCVAARDGVAATLTEKQEQKKTKKGKKNRR